MVLGNRSKRLREGADVTGAGSPWSYLSLVQTGITRSEDTCRVCFASGIAEDSANVRHFWRLAPTSRSLHLRPTIRATNIATLRLRASVGHGARTLIFLSQDCLRGARRESARSGHSQGPELRSCRRGRKQPFFHPRPGQRWPHPRFSGSGYYRHRPFSSGRTTLPASPNTPQSEPDSAPTLTRELLSRYLAGNLAAETRLFERARAALVVRARGHSRMKPIARHVTAEDAVQEVLWRALSSGMLSRFEDRGPGSLEAALSTILDRTLVDFGRRYGAMKRGADQVSGSLDQAREANGRSQSDPASTQTTPTSHARANELTELCQRILDPREREAWELVELRGLDSSQAAASLGTTSASVRGLLLRARAKLVRALSDERNDGELRS